jgi:hypothetical protein
MNTKKLIATCLVFGCFGLMCGRENGMEVSDESIPPITTLTGNREFVKTANNWSSDTGFSTISVYESYQKWLGLKKSEGGTYIYQTAFSSWTGYSINYQVCVVKDSVVRVIRTDSRMDGGTGRVTVLSIKEAPPDSAGHFEKGTIDEVYGYAMDVVATKDTTTNFICLEMFENGLLHSCGFIPKGCIDDCFRGVFISTICFGEIRIEN